jgi:hypothetical protein
VLSEWSSIATANQQNSWTETNMSQGSSPRCLYYSMIGMQLAACFTLRAVASFYGEFFRQEFSEAAPFVSSVVSIRQHRQLAGNMGLASQKKSPHAIWGFRGELSWPSCVPNPRKFRTSTALTLLKIMYWYINIYHESHTETTLNIVPSQKRP